MHGVVVTVKIAAGQFEQAHKALQENVVRGASQAPGFIKGYWFAASDRTSGVSFVVFKTQQDAENASKMVRSNPTPPGVTINSVEVAEVVAEA